MARDGGNYGVRSGFAPTPTHLKRPSIHTEVLAVNADAVTRPLPSCASACGLNCVSLLVRLGTRDGRSWLVRFGTAPQPRLRPCVIPSAWQRPTARRPEGSPQPNRRPPDAALPSGRRVVALQGGRRDDAPHHPGGLPPGEGVAGVRDAPGQTRVPRPPMHWPFRAVPHRYVTGPIARQHVMCYCQVLSGWLVWDHAVCGPESSGRRDSV